MYLVRLGNDFMSWFRGKIFKRFVEISLNFDSNNVFDWKSQGLNAFSTRVAMV
jgi:hypothetical protein